MRCPEQGKPALSVIGLRKRVPYLPRALDMPFIAILRKVVTNEQNTINWGIHKKTMD